MEPLSRRLVAGMARRRQVSPTARASRARPGGGRRRPLPIPAPPPRAAEPQRQSAAGGATVALPELGGSAPARRSQRSTESAWGQDGGRVSRARVRGESSTQVREGLALKTSGSLATRNSALSPTEPSVLEAGDLSARLEGTGRSFGVVLRAGENGTVSGGEVSASRALGARTTVKGGVNLGGRGEAPSGDVGLATRLSGVDTELKARVASDGRLASASARAERRVKVGAGARDELTSAVVLRAGEAGRIAGAELQARYVDARERHSLAYELAATTASGGLAKVHGLLKASGDRGSLGGGLDLEPESGQVTPLAEATYSGRRGLTVTARGSTEALNLSLGLERSSVKGSLEANHALDTSQTGGTLAVSWAATKRMSVELRASGGPSSEALALVRLEYKL